MNTSIKRSFDWGLLLPSLVLATIGVVILFSINLKSQNLILDFSPWKQLLFMIIGLIAMTILSRVEVGRVARYAGWFYVVSLGLMGLVLLFEPVQGSRRWIDLGFFQFQPAEVMKLALIMILARLFHKRGKNINKPWVFALSLIYAAIPAVLALIQPDLGTAVVFGFIWLIMVSMSSVKKTYVVAVILVAVAMVPIAYQYLEPYQQQRVATFLDPAADPQGSGYNTLQATIAIGSGQLFGRGLSGGSQSQLNFLPEQQTDFIFAVIAEKLGFIGSIVVLLALFILIARSIIIANSTPDSFSMFVAIGIVALITFHCMINIGMNLGLLPVKGMPLPFLSYGGTHIIMSFVMVGLLQSISKRRHGLAFKS